MSRHRKPTPPPPITPLVTAAGVLACLWLPLTTAPATASAVTDIAPGPAVVEHTSDLRRATRAPRPIPAWIRAVKAALSKLGTEYLWNNKGPDRFDCSGLTQWSWRQAGINLGPDTYTQILQNIPITDIRPGDLIFPTAEIGARGPGHVQLAIGDGKVVEAPGRGMTVRVVALPPTYVARRVA